MYVSNVLILCHNHLFKSSIYSRWMACLETTFAPRLILILNKVLITFIIFVNDREVNNSSDIILIELVRINAEKV